MNMVMNNDGTGGLFQANSLKVPVTWEDDLRERKLMGQVDLLFTNPPFGSKIPIDDPSILEHYDLGHIWRYDKDTDSWTMTERVQSKQPPEILFIERCVRLLNREPDDARSFCQTEFSVRPVWDTFENGFFSVPAYSRASTYTPTPSSLTSASKPVYWCLNARPTRS